MPAPKSLIGLSVVFAALNMGFLLFLIWVPPYTGFNLIQTEDSQYLQVSRADDWVIEQGLVAGDRVVSIVGSDGSVLDIRAKHVTRSPAERKIYFSSDQEQFTELTKVFDTLDQSNIQVVLEDGRRIHLTLDRLRPLSTLSGQIWLRCLYGLIAWFFGVMLWVWQPRRLETFFPMIAGSGLLIMWTYSASQLGNAEMYYIPPIWAMATDILQGLGTFVFAAAFSCVFFYFPQKLSNANFRSKLILISTAVYALIVVFNDWNLNASLADQILRLTGSEVYLPVPLFLTIGIAHSLLQWRKSISMPVQRAQSLWVLFAASVGPFVWAVFYLLPMRLSGAPILTLSFAPLTILASFLMLVFGIRRFNFFPFERHIGAIAQWTIISLLFFSFDILLVSVARISPENVVLITLGLVLWCYLPLRQWFFDRINRKKQNNYQQTFNEVIVKLITGSFSLQQSSQQAWQEAVQTIFDPISATVESPSSGLVKGSPVTGTASSQLTSSVEDRGQLLRISAHKYSEEIVLDSASQGARLFNDDDVAAVDTLHLLFQQLYEFQDAYQSGQMEERQRIRRDLHDQIGSKLLSIIYSANVNKSRLLAQQTVEQLSELISALKTEPVSLITLKLELKKFCEETCSGSGISLIWQEGVTNDLREINSKKYLNILNLVREFLSNTVKHADATTFNVSIIEDKSFLIIQCTDDGKGFSVDNIISGNGLKNIESRIKEIDARAEWNTKDQTHLQVHIPLSEVSLKSKAVKSREGFFSNKENLVPS